MTFNPSFIIVTIDNKEKKFLFVTRSFAYCVRVSWTSFLWHVSTAPPHLFYDVMWNVISLDNILFKSGFYT